VKARRQSAILDAVRHEPVRSQEQLRRQLRAAGFDVTQATLSRDIRELGLVKTADGYAVPGDEGATSHLPSVERLVREFVYDVKSAQNLVVLKTSAGSAQPVAAALDAEEWKEVMGTLGGDDTILIVSPDARQASRLVARIRELLD
jgi:transcriptional regulator of arginine metabolism